MQPIFPFHSHPNRIPIIVVFLLCFSFSSLAKADEKDELASTLRLLEQVQLSLERARAADAQAGSTLSLRYLFDYQQATADLKTIQAGINHYLEPARAQPREDVAIGGSYRRERP